MADNVEDDATALPFANDGSFMEMFLKVGKLSIVVSRGLCFSSCTRCTINFPWCVWFLTTGTLFYHPLNCKGEPRLHTAPLSMERKQDPVHMMRDFVFHLWSYLNSVTDR
jgi:hypothetical protein